MFNPGDLHWSDIESEPVEGKAYLDHISSMKERIMHQSNYKAYKPNSEIIRNLKAFFDKASAKMKIFTLGATWCKTCADVKPSLIKVVEAVDSPNLRIFLLGGVKTTMQSTDEEYEWSRNSPPEFQNPKFAANQIPLVYFFDESGQCLTRIEKYPNDGLSFEEAILKIAQKHIN